MDNTIRMNTYAAIAIAGLVLLSGCNMLGAVSLSPDELKKKYGTPADRYIHITATPEEIQKKYGKALDPILIKKGLDITVRYRDEGQGQPVLLLHGVCASLETWDGWAQRMKGSFRIISVDIPGFGLTGPAPDTSYYNKDIAVDFVDLLMDRLGIRQFSIVGNSLGGYISWNYALKYPHKIRKMILVDPIGYNQDLPFILSFAGSPVIRPFARSMMPRWMLDMAVKQVYGDKSKATPEIRQQYFDFAMREGNKSSYVDVFAEIIRVNNIPGLSKDIPRIKVPTMLMWGTRDEWIPYTWMESWKKDLPSAKFVSYEGAGHIPMEEVPDKTAADAMTFLR